MDTQRIKDFLRDLFTLRTVWIDRGQGQWSVKKRMHPLLRGIFCTLILIISATIYAGIQKSSMNVSLPQPEPAVAKTIEPESATPSEETILPVKQIAMRREIILPSEANPETDRIMIPITRPNPTEIRREESTEERIPEPRTFSMPNDGKYRILVSKSEYKLWLLNGNDIIQEYSIATGKNPGDKVRVGDHRTPVGNFRIVSIENSSGWSHDFRDGKGKIKGAYGPWFLRLDAKGWKGIGIHGTHDPDSRGTSVTEGCIRLSNEDIDELKQYAYKNMPVIIRENW